MSPSTRFAHSHVLKLLLAITAIGLLWLTLAYTSAQSVDGCPDGPNCIAADNFDTDLDGWTSDYATTSWMSDKALGLIGNANGVMHIYDQDPNSITRSTLMGPGAYKIFWLEPGLYRIMLRGGQDATLLINGHAVEVSIVTGRDFLWSGNFSAWYYSSITTDIFAISQPGNVRIEVAPEVSAYYDYIWLERLPEDYPTLTPIGWTNTPGPSPTITAGPSPTPSVTPISTDQRATPIATGTPVCRDVTSTPSGIGEYTSGTPTPTPANRLSELESFSQSTAIDLNPQWSRIGSVTMNQANDHTEGGSWSAALRYDPTILSLIGPTDIESSPPYGDITTTTFSDALILTTGYGFAIWLNAWAQSDIIPISHTAQMEIWQELGDQWYFVYGAQVSPGHWYPLHASIDAAASHIAFVATRSDNPTTGYILLDDVYLYAPETNSPYCSGAYPSDVTDISGGPASDDGSVPIWWPVDRDCPPAMDVPNNFWGPLLKGITIFIYEEFAWAPLHPIGIVTATAQNTLMSPIGMMFTLAAIMFDWTVPLWVLKLWMGWQGIYFVILLWRIVRYSTVQ